jgi:hypothetical protein
LETASLFANFFSHVYRFFDQYLVTHVLTFIRGFEFAIIMMAATIFVLIAVGIMLRQLRRLPKSYSVDIRDLDGRQVTIDGLRQRFSTYDAAESYARYYRQTYDRQYTFKVVGNSGIGVLQH